MGIADEVFTMRKLILLLILLGSIMLLHRVVNSETTIEVYESQDLYILAVSSPSFVKTEIRATKIEREFFDIISQYDWDAELAYKIMLCESSGNPQAHNFNHRTRDNSVGLFQVNLYGALANERPNAEWLRVAENNIEYAYSLYKGRGWGHWSNCYRKVR